MKVHITMSYAIKGQLDFRGQNIPVLKPDNVSLGKCVTCHQFIRQYSSINDLEIINMLKDGCIFKGFKRMRIESAEKEGFASMHFVLLLSDKDETRHKQVCIRRISKLRLDFRRIEETSSEVLTSSCSAVIIIIDKRRELIILYHFKKFTMKTIDIPLVNHQHWKFVLMSDILYVENNSLFFVNFHLPKPFVRNIKIEPYQEAIAYSNEMLVLVQQEEETEQQSLVCDMLQLDHCQKQIIPSEEVMEILFDTTLNIVHVKDKFVWLACSTYSISVLTSKLVDEMFPCFVVKLSDLFPHCSNFSFKTMCYCNSTAQVFIVYSRSYNDEINSAVIILDLNTLSVSSILELEMTWNRRPQIDMHASMSGHKLFVQEIFENKVIFYQVFKLVPNNLTLLNITKQFIWENLSEEVENIIYLPKHLRSELSLGF